MKTGIAKVELKNTSEHDEYEAILWKDDDEENLSISLPDPFDGISSSKDAERLGKALVKWAAKMKKAGQ